MGGVGRGGTSRIRPRRLSPGGTQGSSVCTSLPGNLEKYAFLYLLPFSSFQKCVGWQGNGLVHTSSPLSPQTAFPGLEERKNNLRCTTATLPSTPALSLFLNLLPIIQNFQHMQTADPHPVPSPVSLTASYSSPVPFPLSALPKPLPGMFY